MVKRNKTMFLKSIIKLLALSLIPFSGVGQVSKNQWVINAAASAEYTERTTDGRNSIQISAPVGAGYFVLNKWAIGLQTFYGYRKGLVSYPVIYDGGFTRIVSHEQKNNQFAVQLFSRYYFLAPTNKFNFYVEAAYGTGQSNTDKTFTNFDSRQRINVISASVAPVFFINKHVALELKLSYINQQHINQQIRFYDGYQITSLQAGLGIQFYFN